MTMSLLFSSSQINSLINKTYFTTFACFTVYTRECSVEKDIVQICGVNSRSIGFPDTNGNVHCFIPF